MHSSHLNRIRILKPRRKANLKNLSTKSFTINKDKSSDVSNSKVESLPPLESPQAEISQEDKWVGLPIYVLNVQSGQNKSDNLVLENMQGKTKENEILNINNDKLTIITSSSNNLEPQNQQEQSQSILTRESNQVNCFLCPKQFRSVEEMQTHYLANHKNKKRLANSYNSTKSSRKVSTQSSINSLFNVSPNSCITGDGEPKCPICSIYFKTEDEVKDHMTKVHCYECSDCHNIYYTLFQLTDHYCVKFAKQKKPKIRKKKCKVQTTTKSLDPLAVSTEKVDNTSLTHSKLVPILPKPNSPFKPVIFNCFSTNSTQLTASSIATPTQVETLNNEEAITSEGNKEIEKDSTLPSNTSPNNIDSSFSKTRKSLLNCSMEELTSVEFNRIKLNEIVKNPRLSVTWIPSKPKNENKNEWYSCGRCNVLCDDESDYLDHLEECLRLSNVSLIPTEKFGGRILKLKSEVVSHKQDNSPDAKINNRLLKELEGFMKPEDLEYFKPSETSANGRKQLTSDLLSKEENTLSMKSISDSLKTDISNNTADKAAIRQPMVIIPISNRLESNTTAFPNTKIAPDFPDISITDKNNSVTWNFIGSEKGSVVQMHSGADENAIILPKESTSQSSENLKPNFFLKSTPSSKLESLEDTDMDYIKSEPLSPLISATEDAKVSLDEINIKEGSIEFTLDEDIKMEMDVQEELMDDNF